MTMWPQKYGFHYCNQSMGLGSNWNTGLSVTFSTEMCILQIGNVYSTKWEAHGTEIKSLRFKTEMY